MSTPPLVGQEDFDSLILNVVRDKFREYTRQVVIVRPRRDEALTAALNCGAFVSLRHALPNPCGPKRQMRARFGEGSRLCSGSAHKRRVGLNGVGLFLTRGTVRIFRQPPQRHAIIPNQASRSARRGHGRTNDGAPRSRGETPPPEHWVSLARLLRRGSGVGHCSGRPALHRPSKMGAESSRMRRVVAHRGPVDLGA